MQTRNKLATDHVPIEYSRAEPRCRGGGAEQLPLRRDSSRAEFTPLGEDHAAEYFFASDASAIVEHTNRVIYLEDDDVAAVADTGNLTIHRISGRQVIVILPTILCKTVRCRQMPRCLAGERSPSSRLRSSRS